jgi:hypothetical protein
MVVWNYHPCVNRRLVMFETIIKVRFTEMKCDANRRHVPGHASTPVSKLMPTSWQESERVAVGVKSDVS